MLEVRNHSRKLLLFAYGYRRGEKNIVLSYTRMLGENTVLMRLWVQMVKNMRKEGKKRM